MVGIALTGFIGASGFFVSSNISGLAIQSDKKIVVAGRTFGNSNPSTVDYDIALARYLSGTVGSENLFPNKMNASIFPNPLDENSLLQLQIEKEEPISIRVLNLEGKVFSTVLENKKLSSGEHNFIINSDGLTHGVYIVAIERSNGIFYYKVLK